VVRGKNDDSGAVWSDEAEDEAPRLGDDDGDEEEEEEEEEEEGDESEDAAPEREE
jgi:hypothetical protein